jgi:hypothetical protein
MDRRSFFGLGAAAFAMPLIGSKVLAAETKKIEVGTFTLRDGELNIVHAGLTLDSGEVLKTPPNMVFTEDGNDILTVIEKRKKQFMPLFELAAEGPQGERFMRNAVQKQIDEKLDILSKMGCHKALILIRTPIVTIPCVTANGLPEGTVAFTNVAIGGWRN